MSDNRTSSTLAGVGSGAASGAGIGTSITPGVGTAVGAIAGAILGGVTGNVTARENEKRRKEEIERIQKREDSAQRRSAMDSMAAGIDPRLAGVTPAGSAGVAPIQNPMPSMAEMTSAVGATSNTISEQIRQKGEVSNFLASKYQEYLQAAEINLHTIDSQINDTIDKASTTFDSSSDIVSKYDNQYTSRTSDMLRDLSSSRTVDSRVYDKFEELKRASNRKKDASRTALLQAWEDTKQSRQTASFSGEIGLSSLGASASLGATAEFGGSSSESGNTSAEDLAEKEKASETGRSEAGEKSHQRELTDEEISELASELSYAIMSSISRQNSFRYTERDIASRAEWSRLLMSLYLRKSRYEKAASKHPSEFFQEFYDDSYQMFNKLKFPR